MSNECKTKIPRILIDAMVVLIIAAYGFIFNGVIKSIDANTTRINGVETRIEQLNPVLLQIQTSLAEIKKDIEWIKNK